MKTFLLVLVLILAQLLFSHQASADINLCNSTSHTIWISFGEQYSFSNDVSDKDWIAGWYKTEPGQCSTPETGISASGWPRSSIIALGL